MNKLTDSQTKLDQMTLIKDKLINAGIVVSSGKKISKQGEYSGIVGENREILELNI